MSKGFLGRAAAAAASKGILFGLLLAVGGGATVPAEAEEAASAGEIQRWIADLGSDDYETRERATEALAACGPAARPALEEAARSPDPEVRYRARTALARLAREPDADTAARDGGGRVQAQSVRISEGPDGVRVEVSRTEDGKTTTRVYEAEDRAAFKEKHPEIYAQYLSRDRGVEIGGLRLFWRGPGDGPGGGGGDLLADRLEDLLHEHERCLRKAFPEDGDFFRPFGEGDPAAPRGAGGLRLGVTVQDLPGTLASHLRLEGGALVEHVAPGSAADKAGLARWDVVVSFDGRPVRDPDDLRRFVARARAGKPLAVEIIREGERKTVTVTLEAPDGE